MEKEELRRRINRKIFAIPEESRIRMSLEIQEKLASLPEFSAAGCVAGYAAMPFEVSTGLVLRRALEQNKTVCLPRTDWDRHVIEMVCIEDLDAELKLGDKGILEPVGDFAVCPGDIDLLIVPGRAFDSRCNRMGQGGGFYDSFMQGLRPDCFRCGMAFDIQIVDAIPTESHDVPVDAVIAGSSVCRR